MAQLSVPFRRSGLLLAALLVTASATAQPLLVTTLAGPAGAMGSADGAGAAARLAGPYGIAVDRLGTAYVTDQFNHTVRKVSAGGDVSTLAGLPGYFGSIDGTGSDARLNGSAGVAVGPAGDLFVVDQSNHTIRKVTTAGVVTTFAGVPGAQGSADGVGSEARFFEPSGIAIDPLGNLFVSDSGNQTIRKVTPSGAVTTIAGTAGAGGFADGTGAAARFAGPSGLALDTAGNLYVADYVNRVVRKITPAWTVSTLAGAPGEVGIADGTGSAARFGAPTGLTALPSGDLALADSGGHTIRRITLAGVVTTLAGLGASPGSADGGGGSARFYQPTDVASDADGNVLVVDRGNNLVRKVFGSGLVVTLCGLSGASGSTDGAGAAARFYSPQGAAVAPDGSLVVADTLNQTIRRIDPAGNVTTLAGLAGVPGFADGAGAAARFYNPSGVAVGPGGFVYVTDSVSCTIRRVSPQGTVTTVAGQPFVAGFSDGAGTAALFRYPSAIAVDPQGSLVVSDLGNHALRRVTPDGTVTTLPGITGFDGADPFRGPQGLAVEPSGSVVFADSWSFTLRRWTPPGTVATVAGLPRVEGTADGVGGEARFRIPMGVALGPSGDVFVADFRTGAIRKVRLDGTVSTVAGLPLSAGSVDGTGAAARLALPYGLAYDGASGALYVADAASHSIRKLVPAPNARCESPLPPRFASVPSGAVPAGNPFTLRWSSTLAASDAGATYRLELSARADCGAPSTLVTGGASATVPTGSGQASVYCAVVRAVSGAGCVSEPSERVRVYVQIPPAAFTVVQPQQPRGIATVGSAPPSGSTVVFRNIGGTSATLELASALGLAVPEPSTFANVAPGQEVTASLRFDTYATLATGFQSDALVGSWSDGTGTRTVSTAVTLTVLASPPSDAARGARLSPSGTSEIHFVKSGGAPPIQQLTLVNTGTAPVRVAPAIGPGGAWLSVRGDFSTPIAPGASRSYALAVDRTKRATSDGTPPVSTYLRMENVDGDTSDAAVLAIYDEEPAPPGPGAFRAALGEGETSLVFGSSVSASGSGGSIYLSDGWLRNRAGTPAAVELYYTPDGADGLSDPGVRRASLTVPPWAVYRLSDFVRGLFGTTGSGLVELRSPQLPQLSVRTTVDSLLRKEGRLARYGAEVPVLRGGEGAGVSRYGGAPLHITGLRGGEGSDSRTNLILSETSGARAEVVVRLRSAGGAVLSEKPVAVPPYSKVQVNAGDASLFPDGVRYDGASLEVVPVGGAGTVGAFATVIDNASQGYRTRAGELLAADVPAAKGNRAAVVPERLVLAGAARAEGANGSFFTTSISVTNGTGQDAALSVRYLPEGGAPTEARALVVPARQTVTVADVVEDLFGLTTPTRGMVFLEGDLGRVVVASETSTPIDVSDPARGRSPTALAAHRSDGPQVVGTPASGASLLVVSHPALEETASFRTNLILAEVAGSGATVRIRLFPKGTAGVPLAEELVTLGPFERLQLDRFLPFVAGGGPGQQLADVETTVEAVDGVGRVLVVATRIDNDPDSKRADAFVFGATGIGQGGIGVGR